MPFGIFLLIAAITLISVFAIERGETQRLNTQLEARTIAIGSALERRANASSAYLRAGAALLSTMDDVPQDEFNRFVSELRLDTDYRGAEGMGWAEVVWPAEVADFDALMAQSHTGTHQLHPRPDGSQPFSVPVTYLQPDTERSRRALGFDMFSEATRRAAMMRAAESEQPTASDRVVLQQEGGASAPGFLIYMPVFEAAANGRRLKGFIYSPLNAHDFLTSALAIEEAGAYGVQLSDGKAGAPGALLATNVGSEIEQRDQNPRTLIIANNSALLMVSRAEKPMLSGLSVATLIFGLLVASLLTIVVRMLTQQALEDEASLAWFAEQASIRNSLTRELNHRVKNTLANVLSIIALTRRRADNIEGFADGLDGRIRALSATHDLLTNSEWGSTPVSAVIQAELLPYVQSGDHDLAIGGPEIDLAPNDALSLGLAVHELATNAAKYGVLSDSGGRLSVTWESDGDKFVRVEWLERGGPPVPQKRCRGFGTDLIERVVARELHTPVELEFAPEGVRCVLQIPIRRAHEFTLRADRPALMVLPQRKARVAMHAEARAKRSADE